MEGAHHRQGGLFTGKQPDKSPSIRIQKMHPKELWGTLKQDNNLEDKVFLEACKDDMNKETGHNAEITKGKRRSIKPKYLEDYVAK